MSSKSGKYRITKFRLVKKLREMIIKFDFEHHRDCSRPPGKRNEIRTQTDRWGLRHTKKYQVNKVEQNRVYRNHFCSLLHMRAVVHFFLRPKLFQPHSSGSLCDQYRSCFSYEAKYDIRSIRKCWQNAGCSFQG